MTLSEILRKIKTDRGLKNQTELANLLGVRQQRVSNWMKGSDDIETLWTVFKKILLDIDPMALYDDLDDPRAVYRLSLVLFDDLPEEYKEEFRRAVREAAEKKLTTRSNRPEGPDETAKRRGSKKTKR